LPVPSRLSNTIPNFPSIIEFRDARRFKPAALIVCLLVTVIVLTLISEAKGQPVGFCGA